MKRGGLIFINFCFAGLALLLAIATCGIASLRPSEISIPSYEGKKPTLPKNAFARSKSDYDAIENSILALPFTPPAMQLPNLRTQLIYFGPNGRPDVSTEATALHFALADGKSQASVAPGQKLYILYDRKQNPPRYVFSPQNAETSLSLEAEVKTNEADIRISMKNEQGIVVQEPASHAQFTLQTKESNRFMTGTTSWELGKTRVDGTLLARQHARWYGQDRFLERHGGEEFQDLSIKHRLDFGEADDRYSVYVGVEDLLAWQDNKWHPVKSGEDSIGKPLLQIKKIEERLMVFSIWDPEGKSMLTLNLLKSTEQLRPNSVQQDFKFLAARTRSQFVFEVSKERMLMRPQDWLLLTETGWKKLTTEQEIDDYVNRKIVGQLFVFDGIVKKEDNKQVIVGTLFNTARSEMQTVEIEVPQANITVIKMPNENSIGKL